MAEIISPYFNDPYKGTVDTSNAALIQDAYKERYRKRQAEETKKAAAAAKKQSDLSAETAKFTEINTDVMPYDIALAKKIAEDYTAAVASEYKLAEAENRQPDKASFVPKLVEATAKLNALKAKKIKALADLSQYENDIANDNFKVTDNPQLVDYRLYTSAEATEQDRSEAGKRLQGLNAHDLYKKESSYNKIEAMMQETAKKLGIKPTVPREIKDLKGNIRAIEKSYTPEDTQTLLKATLASHPKAGRAMAEYMAELGMANASPEQPEAIKAQIDLANSFLQPEVDASFKPQPSGGGLNFDFGGARKVGNDVIGEPVELSKVDMPRNDYVKLKAAALQAKEGKGTGDMSKVEKSYGELYDRLNAQSVKFYPVSKYATNEERERSVTLDIPSGSGGKTLSISGLGNGYDVDKQNRITSIRVTIPEKTIKAKNDYEDDVVIPAYRDIIPATAENWARYVTAYPGVSKVVKDDGLIAPVNKGESGAAKSEPVKTATKTKVIVKKGYNAKTNQTQLIYEDGTKEIVNGKR